MNPIRPNFPPPATTGARPVRPDVRAAQKAFFNAVTQAAPAAPRPEPIRAAPAAARTTADPQETPTRYLRPGSLVDIKV